MSRFLLLSVFLLSLIELSGQSPSYKDFEWDILRFGYVASSSEGETSGFSFGGELRYNATDNFSIGLGGDVAVFGDDFGDNTDLGVSTSSLIIGDYYLRNDSGTRGFFGLGVGLFSNGTLTIRNGNAEDIIDGTSGLGIAPRAGFEFGHIRLQGQYNLTFKEGHSNYFGLTVALTLWGGYKGQ